MIHSALNVVESGRQGGAESVLALGLNDVDIFTNNISDEALEASSGIENLPMYLLPCTAAPCVASTFCSNKC